MATKPNAKAKTSSPRVTVLVGQVKKKVGGKDTNVNVYSYMKKNVADALGLKATTATASPTAKSGSSTKKRSPVPARGSVGSGSITVILADKKKYSLPLPAGITIAQTIAFLQKNVKNAVQFVTKNGVTRSLEKSK